MLSDQNRLWDAMDKLPLIAPTTFENLEGDEDSYQPFFYARR